MSETILTISHLRKDFGSNQVLKDVDFQVEKGDVTCIIGASGSGKSTLLRCINLLETPTSGEILFHGQSILTGKVDQCAYRAKVGMVFQSFNLFNNMTVLENCIVGQTMVLKKGKEEARQAAMLYLERVGMAPYINAKPRQISGGQKQRSSIARALLKNAPVLIMDDSLSAVDTDTEEQILENLIRLRKGKTTIIIAHRVSTLQKADHIAVLTEGELTEYGTHDELIREGGFYAKIYEKQQLEQELNEM